MVRSVLLENVRRGLIPAIFLLSHVLSGQDVHFSSPELTPLYINPSLTGDFDGNLRLLSLYQAQGSGLGRAISSSFDFKKNRVGTNGFAFGLSGYSLNVNSHDYELSLSTSYTQILSKTENTSNSISIGVKVGLVSEEWEIENNLEVGSGILWKYITQSRIKVKAGLAFFYVNKPERSYDNGTRWNLHAELEFPISRDVILIPNVVLTSQTASEASNIYKVSTKVFLDRSYDPFWLQIGIFRESNNTVNHIWAHGSDDPAFGFSSIIKLDQMLLGFTIDRHFDLGINIYEMSFGYIFRKKQPSNVNLN